MNCRLLLKNKLWSQNVSLKNQLEKENEFQIQNSSRCLVTSPLFKTLKQNLKKTPQTVNKIKREKK